LDRKVHIYMYIEGACYLLVLARTRAQDRIGVGAAPLPSAGPLVKYVAGRCREPRHENATRMKPRGKRCIGGWKRQSMGVY
jgi:hypothetical protein